MGLLAIDTETRIGQTALAAGIVTRAATGANVGLVRGTIITCRSNATITGTGIGLAGGIASTRTARGLGAVLGANTQICGHLALRMGKASIRVAHVVFAIIRLIF